MQRLPALSIIFLVLLTLSACSSRPPLRLNGLQQNSTYKEAVMVNREGLHLFTRTWEPVGKVKANIVLLHGISLHGGVYREPARQLAVNGYRVIAMDLQGWGRSEGQKGTGYVKQFDDYTLDVKELLQQLRRDDPELKNYVLGESFGGVVALHAAVKIEFLLDGVITSGPLFKPNLKLLGFRVPDFLNEMGLTSAKWVSGAMSSLPVMDADVGLRVVVDDDYLQDNLLDDPYVYHGWLPAAFVNTTLEANDYIEPRLRYISVPMLMLQGQNDVLVPPSSSQQIYDESGSRRKQMYLYNSPNSVLLEDQWRYAVADIVKFLDGMN